MPDKLSRELVVSALSRLNDELRRRDARGEVCLFGGAVMVLTFEARPATKDVDAVFHPSEAIRQIAEDLRQELDLPEGWLNDGVKGWLSPQGETTQEGLPQFSHLRLTRPTASYLLAMKCLAARAPGPEGKGDREDIALLIEHLGLKKPEEVFATLSHYYPNRLVLPKTEYLVRELFHERTGQ